MLVPFLLKFPLRRLVVRATSTAIRQAMAVVDRERPREPVSYPILTVSYRLFRYKIHISVTYAYAHIRDVFQVKRLAVELTKLGASGL